MRLLASPTRSGKFTMVDNKRTLTPKKANANLEEAKEPIHAPKEEKWQEKKIAARKRESEQANVNKSQKGTDGKTDTDNPANRSRIKSQE
ncbi:hypothetical protein JTB14_023439 [Gonioctena quinquepunctata]|nr:hypothetical protein JTB14_023439 [Gonioctena quinquepunctata]